MKVSACIITYNHERFIAQAIEGALSQEVSSPYEIVIGEDCSTDKTREIIESYQKKYPGRIRTLFNEKNLGMMGNWISTIGACEGEYVALCEGDDYWTDPLKLQKQVDFLDKNPTYSISSHNVKIIDDRDSSTRLAGPLHDQTLSLKEILKNGSGGATCSLTFRKDVYGTLPAWFKDQTAGDWQIQILCTAQGKMKYFGEIMGVYRKHVGGAKSAQITSPGHKVADTIALHLKNVLSEADVIDKHFSYKYTSLLNHQRDIARIGIVDAYLARGDFQKAQAYARASLLSCLITRPKKMLKFLAVLWLPTPWAHHLLGKTSGRAGNNNTEDIFSRIFQTNRWGGKDSISGTGSDSAQTEVLVRELPTLFEDLEIKSILDAPCGDFHWMRKIDLSNVQYTGIDIVPDIIKKDAELYSSENVSFKHLDLIKDDLPKSDLVLCRDCLVHLSFEDMRKALKNICRSGSKFLLTTTFPKHPLNHDIKTGKWRTLDLTSKPLSLPPPLRLINEHCTEGDGTYSDKSLGLWEIKDIARIIH